MNIETFSKRHGYDKVEHAEITVREGAPPAFRDLFVVLVGKYPVLGYPYKSVRNDVVYKILNKLPNDDPSDWQDDKKKTDITGDIKSCKWNKVYDIYEKYFEYIKSYRQQFDSVQKEVNDFLIEHGIGWKVICGRFKYRGSESFEKKIRSTEAIEKNGLYKTASTEIRQALNDLSKKPMDITGAIQHAMASLECVTRTITGDEKLTLGKILNNNKELVPKPLDQALSKLWGYASDNGRHLKEGREPKAIEAELIVGISASIGEYLVNKYQTIVKGGKS